MQRLNDKELRSDPFNHTIHAVEFLTFHGLVFMVMPRYDVNYLDSLPFSNIPKDGIAHFLPTLQTCLS